MANYPRTEEGFSRAFNTAVNIARMHPGKEYALYVDSRWPNRYGVSLAGLVHKEYVESGTTANIITGEGLMIPLFPEEK